MDGIAKAKGTQWLSHRQGSGLHRKDVPGLLPNHEANRNSVLLEGESPRKLGRRATAPIKHYLTSDHEGQVGLTASLANPAADNLS